MRCFLAVELTAPARAVVRELQYALTDLLEKENLARILRWSNPAGIHLTLRFLGETSRRQIDSIAAALPALGGGQAAVVLQGLGCFPNWHRPSIVWVGVDGQHDEVARLLALQRKLELLARQTGFESDNQRFTPHVTIGRVRREAERAALQRAGEILAEAAESSALRAWTLPLLIDAVTLVESDLRPSGPVYRPLARVAIGR